MTDSTPQAPVTGTVEFVQHILPGLDSGAYLLSVSEKLSTQEALPGNRYFFAVAGKRWTLDPADLYASFPPDQAVGEFDGTLPHMVLTNRTLPWQRYPTLDQPPRFFPNSPHDRDVPTWLAVLTFDADDEAAHPGFSAQARDAAVRDLFIPQTGAAGIGHSYFWEAGNTGPTSPDLADYLDFGETPDDRCRILDVPMALFRQVAPSVDDLKMMAHVRNVNIVKKATQNGVPAGRNDLSAVPGTSDFALVMGNRLPQTNKRTFCHLVSLEGLAPFLPVDPAATDAPGEVTYPVNATGEGGTPQVPIADADFMRLVSLASWSFTSTGDSRQFEALVSKLVPKTAGATPDYAIGLPLKAPTAVEPAETQSARKALGMGFTALDHHSRDGGHTVSWYRGPLVPAAIDVAMVPATMPSADAATRYDPASGMFDLSYAGAWQAGRLLAIADTRFSTLLVNWRRQNLADVVTRMEALVVSQSLDAIQAQLRDDSLIMPLLQAFAPPQPSPATRDAFFALARRAVPASTMAIGGARALRSDDQRALLTDANALALLLTPDLQVPLDLYKWLASLKLLQGVPFRYLVPDEAMLPAESIRIFHLDMSWVNALIDGALSIGRAGPSTPQAAHDGAVRATLHTQAVAAARQMRPAALGLATINAATDPAPVPFETVTGFVLRSEVVKGWPGLEVNGYADDGTLLDIVRFERLAPTVLLCLFEKDGKTLKQLDIHEPAEGLHFGLSGDGKAVNLRYNHQNGNDGPGTQVPGVLQPATLRADPRTLRLFRLSKALLDPKYATYITGIYSGFDHLPSSQFAMQMLRGVGLVSFIFGEGAL